MNDVMNEQDIKANYRVWRRAFEYYKWMAHNRAELPGKRGWARERMQHCARMMQHFSVRKEQHPRAA